MLDENNYKIEWSDRKNGFGGRICNGEIADFNEYCLRYTFIWAICLLLFGTFAFFFGSNDSFQIMTNYDRLIFVGYCFINCLNLLVPIVKLESGVYTKINLFLQNVNTFRLMP
ncbi:MAG: hypothetical protein HQK93_08155 [Nitrospirae bacterium]|nr:hypothetical protein [Nitrospirota bacterium]